MQQMSAYPSCIDGSRAHHWRIDTPRPGVSTVAGHCVRCGASRDYPVYLPYLEIEGGWKEVGKRVPEGLTLKMTHLPI